MFDRFECIDEKEILFLNALPIQNLLKKNHINFAAKNKRYFKKQFILAVNKNIVYHITVNPLLKALYAVVKRGAES